MNIPLLFVIIVTSMASCHFIENKLGRDLQTAACPRVVLSESY